MLKKFAAIGLAAGALVLAAPAVATASPTLSSATSSDSYAETPEVKVNKPIIDMCEVSTIVFGPGYFLPSERVGVSISGLRGAASKVSGNIAAADGSLTLTFRPPANGNGAYAVAFTGSRSYTAVITVSNGHDAAKSCDHDPRVAPAGKELPLTGGPGSSSGAGFELALTGGSVSPWIFGGGAVALVAGGALVTAGMTRRKQA